MTDREERLINIAERGNDNQSAEAMKQLREEFDPTYGWCSDCDSLVVKESECCMNKSVEEIVLENLFSEDEPYE